MKKFVLAGATALALIMGAAANGQSVSEITQDGSEIEADVEQSGANTSTIEQTGTLLDADLIQSGEGNSSIVTQFDDDNLAEIIQEGGNNQSTVSQGGLPFFPGQAVVFVEQIGDNNISNVNQRNDAGGQIVDITQTGDMNNSLIDQGTSSVSGGNNFVLVQTGGMNSSITDQGFNSDNNRANVLQEGSGNQSTISQQSFLGAAGNDIDLDQLADGARSTISQSGGQNNSATVVQYVDAHISVMNQVGNGNVATVTQGSPDT